MRLFRLAAAAAMFVAGMAGNADAAAVMHINDGTAYLFSGEVHPISTPSVTILENGSGNPVLANPLLLILGIPNTTSFAAPSITLSTGLADLGGAGTGTNTTYSGSYNGSTGLATHAGLFNSGEVYSFLGLTGGNNSNNFGNWAAADLAVNGISATGFGIFVYELTGTGMRGGRSVSATFNGALPVGTFVVAYGKSANGKVFDTPFTETGMVTVPFTNITAVATPEPGSMLLLGTGLAALFERRRRQARRAQQS